MYRSCKSFSEIILIINPDLFKVPTHYIGVQSLGTLRHDSRHEFLWVSTCAPYSVAYWNLLQCEMRTLFSTLGIGSIAKATTILSFKCCQSRIRPLPVPTSSKSVSEEMIPSRMQDGLFSLLIRCNTRLSLTKRRRRNIKKWFLAAGPTFSPVVSCSSSSLLDFAFGDVARRDELEKRRLLALWEVKIILTISFRRTFREGGRWRFQCQRGNRTSSLRRKVRRTWGHLIHRDRRRTTTIHKRPTRLMIRICRNTAHMITRTIDSWIIVQHILINLIIDIRISLNIRIIVSRVYLRSITRVDRENTHNTVLINNTDFRDENYAFLDSFRISLSMNFRPQWSTYLPHHIPFNIELLTD